MTLSVLKAALEVSRKLKASEGPIKTTYYMGGVHLPRIGCKRPVRSWHMCTIFHHFPIMQYILCPLRINISHLPWWRHQMETYSALWAIYAGNSPTTAQRPVTRSFVVFFDLRLIKWLSKHSRCWWFEMPSHPLWSRCNGPRSIMVTFQTI